MNKKRNNLIHRLGLGLLAIGVLWVASTLFHGGALLADGTQAPAWRLPLLDKKGEKLDLEALRGKVVVLDFWGITCPPCIRQIPTLERIQRQMASRGVAVVGVTIQEEPLEEIQAFVRERPIDYPIVVDKGLVAQAYKVRTLPTLYVLDRNGVVASSHRGLMSLEDLSRAVAEALER